jgi:hypothetical protein
VNVADVIAGTHCIEIARLGELAIPMRALAEMERDDIDRDVRLALTLLLPGALPDELFDDRVWPFVVARSALDPERLIAGEHAPIFTVRHVEGFTSADVDVLLVVQVRAQARACPPLDSRDAKALLEALMKHAGENPWDGARARRCSIVEYFGVPSIRQITHWQHVYFSELTR